MAKRYCPQCGQPMIVTHSKRWVQCLQPNCTFRVMTDEEFAEKYMVKVQSYQASAWNSLIEGTRAFGEAARKSGITMQEFNRATRQMMQATGDIPLHNKWTDSRYPKLSADWLVNNDPLTRKQAKSLLLSRDEAFERYQADRRNVGGGWKWLLLLISVIAIAPGFLLLNWVCNG